MAMPIQVGARSNSKRNSAVARQSSKDLAADVDCLRKHRSRRSEEVSINVNQAVMMQAPLFAGRSPQFLTQLAEYLQIEMFQPGQYIMREGEEGDKTYFLHRGSVEVLVGREEERQVATLQDGTVFGEMAMFGTARRAASVRAQVFCDCRAFDHTIFQMLLQKFPEERKFFMEMAAERRKKLMEEKELAAESEPDARSSKAASAKTSRVSTITITEELVAPLRRNSKLIGMPILPATVQEPKSERSSLCSSLDTSPDLSAKNSRSPSGLSFGSEGPVAEASLSLQEAAVRAMKSVQEELGAAAGPERPTLPLTKVPVLPSINFKCMMDQALLFEKGGHSKEEGIDDLVSDALRADIDALAPMAPQSHSSPKRDLGSVRRLTSHTMRSTIDGALLGHSNFRNSVARKQSARHSALGQRASGLYGRASNFNASHHAPKNDGEAALMGQKNFTSLVDKMRHDNFELRAHVGHLLSQYTGAS